MSGQILKGTKPTRGAAWRMGCDLYVGRPGGGTPVDAIYVAMESMGMTSVRPPNPAISRREAMQELWAKAGLASIETRVLRIPITYSSFDDFWDSNTVPLGPQGKLIDGMSQFGEKATARACEGTTAHQFGRRYCLRSIRKRREGPCARITLEGIKREAADGRDRRY
jgi:hypothetical protein